MPHDYRNDNIKFSLVGH